MDSLLQDLRYALRSLARSPGFTAVATLSLALGMAVCTVVFSVIYAVNFEPLPYRDAGRLAQLGEFMGRQCAPMCLDNVSRETVRIWRQRSQSLEALATADLASSSVGRADQSGAVLMARVDSGFFPLLGVSPLLGRPIQSYDFGADAGAVVVLSRSTWVRLFAGDPQALGRVLTVDGVSRVIVGVMPSEFVFPPRAEAWVPQPPAATSSSANLVVIARLRPQVSIDQAAAELRSISAAIEHENPRSNGGRIGTALSLRAIASGIFSPFWMLLGAVGAALLIACANVASLSMVRALARQRELAVRAALGAGWWRLARQSITEGLVVALAGGAGGVVLAFWGKEIATAVIGRVYNYPLQVTLSPFVLGGTMALASCIGIVVGLAPLAPLRKMDVQRALHEGAVTATAGRQSGRLRQVLVVTEIAAAMVLATGAGLLTASFLRIQDFNLGFDAEHLMVGQWSLSPGLRSEPRQRVLAGARLLERLGIIPGAEFTAVWGEFYPRARKPTLSPSSPFEAAMAIEGRPETGLTMAAVPPFGYDVSPGFFDAAGLRLLTGRGFAPGDNAAGFPVVIVNQEAARLWWPGENPLGRRLRFGPADSGGSWLTVVGVVANSHVIGKAGVFGALVNTGRFPLVFRPLAQNPPRRGTWIGVRAEGNPLRLAPLVRSAIREADPDVELGDLSTMRQLASGFEPLAPVGLNARLLTGFALFGVFLALMGIYSLVADVVRRRTPEIGIRVALGAVAVDILRTVVPDAMRLAGLGTLLGLAASMVVTRVLADQLFGLSPVDPRVLGAIAVVLLITVAAAAWVPALRATHIDPMVALRTE